MAKKADPARRPSGTTAAAKTARPRLRDRRAATGKESGLNPLVQLIDHCMAAKDMADAMDEKFLAYMLAMTIQDARSKLR